MNPPPLKILFLEPFYGGSHRAFADGLRRHSRHAVDLVSLPARFWKWRMRGAALHLHRRIDRLAGYDLLVVTDLMSLADFKALAGPGCPPCAVYFHENQLSYPLAPGERMDYQFGFTDITTALCARRVIFNSRTHRDDFFTRLPRFIGMMPEYRPTWAVAAIRDKTTVLHPGCEFAAGPPPPTPPREDPPLIIWNHRWEFDKDPEAFFAALDAVLARGCEFRLALLGENFQVVPQAFIAARERLGPRVVHYGYAPDRRRYRDWLARGDVVVSTARQENFGIAVVEAMRHGCVPLLPRRLAYPEVVPAAFHAACLYRGQDDLVDRLEAVLRDPAAARGACRGLADAMGAYAWETLAGCYDREFEDIAAAGEEQEGKRERG